MFCSDCVLVLSAYNCMTIALSVGFCAQLALLPSTNPLVVFKHLGINPVDELGRADENPSFGRMKFFSLSLLCVSVCVCVWGGGEES